MDGSHQQFTRHGVVVDYQYPYGHIDFRTGRSQQGSWRNLQGDIEPEAASDALPAFHLKLTAHQADQPLADHQAQTGATKTAAG
ncbi:hypothetical protein D3C87_1437260 [compost metagenome]